MDFRTGILFLPGLLVALSHEFPHRLDDLMPAQEVLLQGSSPQVEAAEHPPQREP